MTDREAILREIVEELKQANDQLKDENAILRGLVYIEVEVETPA